MLDAGYDIRVVHLGDSSTIGLAGEFDLAAAPELRRELLGRLTTGKPVVVDMSEVTYIDSSALAVFVRACKFAAEKGTTFRLVNVSGHSAKVLEITGLDEMLVDPARPADARAT
jgi:anti-anti-sigma factor